MLSDAPASDPKPALRVIKLTERNFKRIESLEVAPGRKSLVLLRGPNEAGKTSALDGLIAALAGKRAAPAVPIRRGAEESVIRLELGDGLAERYEITRSWRGEDTWLTVRELRSDGDRKIAAPQAFLDKLVGELSFDPLRFMRAPANGQVDLLMTAIGKAAVYADFAAKRLQLAEKRKTAESRLAAAEAEVAGNPDPSPGQLLSPVSAAELAAQMANAQKRNQERKLLEQTIENQTRAKEQLEREIAALQTRLAGVATDLIKKRADLDALPAPIDTADLQTHIAKANEHNAIVASQVKHGEKVHARNNAAQVAEGARSAVKDIDAQIRGLLADSAIATQIPGLEIVDGVISHNGVPLAQASGMRQLELSCLIGMAPNPRLRTMCIDEGDSLDDAALARLLEIAEKHDYAVWMTAIRADVSDLPGAHLTDIENGRAVSPSHQKPPAQAAAAANTPASSSAPDFEL